MRHFPFLPEDSELLASPPQPFSRTSPPSVLALALGATLYSPGTRPRLADDARRACALGATSQVWCLEDAIAHADVPAAQANVRAQLHEVTGDGPLLFVRVRDRQQVLDIGSDAPPSLTGFVLPKIAPDADGEAVLEAVEQASQRVGRPLWAMPVLEHPDLAWRETRGAHLAGLRTMFDDHRETVLSLRVGGSDLCGLFGLRRDRDTIIWDVAVVRDALADVLNTFTRGGDFTVTGPVWEHWSSPSSRGRSDRLIRPQLRATPFERSGHLPLRQEMVRRDEDELLREVLLDRANGFVGKTVIHPSHVGIVNALQAVSREDHDDALTVLASRDAGGVSRSSAGNKMNEMGPHGLWAEQVVARAAVYGVLAEPDALLGVLEASRAAVAQVFA